MKILIANDHAGYELKNEVLKYLETQKINFQDFGTDSEDSMDYPDVVHPLCQTLQDEPEKMLGILICGSGNGVCMTANKYPHVRAALCWEKELAKLAREHNNANILCIPARFLSKETALEIIEVFLHSRFEGGRHQNRVNKISRK